MPSSTKHWAFPMVWWWMHGGLCLMKMTIKTEGKFCASTSKTIHLPCGIAIAENVKANGQAAVDGYLQMLQGGCSEPPLDLLRKAGVDLTEPAAIEAALARFDHTISELAELLEVEM